MYIVKLFQYFIDFMFIKGHRFINLNQKTVMCLPSLNKGVIPFTSHLFQSDQDFDITAY